MHEMDQDGIDRVIADLQRTMNQLLTDADGQRQLPPGFNIPGAENGDFFFSNPTMIRLALTQIAEEVLIATNASTRHHGRAPERPGPDIPTPPVRPVTLPNNNPDGSSQHLTYDREEQLRIRMEQANSAREQYNVTVRENAEPGPVVVTDIRSNREFALCLEQAKATTNEVLENNDLIPGCQEEPRWELSHGEEHGWEHVLEITSTSEWLTSYNKSGVIKIDVLGAYAPGDVQLRTFEREESGDGEIQDSIVIG